MKIMQQDCRGKTVFLNLRLQLQNAKAVIMRQTSGTEARQEEGRTDSIKMLYAKPVEINMKSLRPTKHICISNLILNAERSRCNLQMTTLNLCDYPR